VRTLAPRPLLCKTTPENFELLPIRRGDLTIIAAQLKLLDLRAERGLAVTRADVARTLEYLRSALEAAA
jgi:hypothetical protein